MRTHKRCVGLEHASASVQHVSGEGNALADLVSRALWEDFSTICGALRVRPVLVRLAADELAMANRVIDRVRKCKNSAPIPEISDDASSDVVPRWRHLSLVEQGLSRERRDQEQGDGPFEPPFATTARRSAPTSDIKGHTGFRPPFAHGPQGETDRIQPHTTVRAATPPSQSVAYLTPIRQAASTPAESNAKRLAEKLGKDRSPGRIEGTAEQLYDMALAVELARSDGRNPRTMRKDDKAWRDFQEFAHLRGFDPNLRPEWMSAHPERENLKLASYLLFVAQRMKPRSHADHAVKPMSVYQRYLSLRRHFAPNVDLPKPKAVQMVLHGLVQRFLKHYGITALRPRRVEPMTMNIIRRLVSTAKRGTQRVSGRVWSLNDWTCFVVTAWEVINICVGSRKGESALLPMDPDMRSCFTRDCLTWRISNQVVVDPSPHHLAALAEGDCARLAPKGAKCDQWGMCYGTDPIILPYHDDECNPAKWLAMIEKRWPCPGSQRAGLALFCDAQGAPFSSTTLHRLITATLTNELGEAARMYSPHSWRVGMASALKAAGATDAQIQAFGRWISPDSVRVYARMSVPEYSTWMDKLMKVSHLDALRTTNIPIMDAEEMLAPWGGNTGLFRMHPTPHAPNRPPSRPRTPAAPNESPPRTRGTPTLERRRRGRRRQRSPPPATVDAGSTTGVGRLVHLFPSDLTQYRTFWERPPGRRDPVLHH